MVMKLDFKTVKALSSPTRVRILNEVMEKGATPTSLSRRMELSKSTISAHLKKLEDSGLVDKDKEEGRKRVVYSATDKSKAIVSGKERKVKFSIASPALGMFGGLGLVAGYFNEMMTTAARQSESMSTMTATTASEAASQETSMLAQASPEILLYTGVALLGLSVLGFAAGWTLNQIGNPVE